MQQLIVHLFRGLFIFCSKQKGKDTIIVIDSYEVGIFIAQKKVAIQVVLDENDA